MKYANRIIFWSLPPLILFALFRRLDNPNLVGTVGVLWAFCIAVYVTSGYLYEKEINIERVKGRFAGLRRSWFRLVKGIPLIGKRPPAVQGSPGCIVRDPYGYVRSLGS